MKDDRAPELRSSIGGTDHVSETVGDLAGYILQGDPQASTPNCRALSNTSPSVPAAKS